MCLHVYCEYTYMYIRIHLRYSSAFIIFIAYFCIVFLSHTHTQVLHGANPVLWDPKRTVRWNQDRQREQGGVEWGGYARLDHTAHPLLHTGCTPTQTNNGYVS